jgi:flavin reductase (DIM6/NTAB) family NADH-FMN oxidoreductase RutF
MSSRLSSADQRSFRQWFGGFATGVTVITARDAEGTAHGITINSVTSVSLEPPLLLFCLVKTAHLYPLFRKAKHFAVNVLNEDQEDLSRYFADPRHHAMPKNIWERAQADRPPLLRHTLGWMICQRNEIYKGGDHDIVLGKAVSWHKRSTKLGPLLYFHSRYRKIGE